MEKVSKRKHVRNDKNNGRREMRSEKDIWQKQQQQTKKFQGGGTMK